MEAVKKVMFIHLLLQSMKISVKLPIMVRVDNMVAIFMVTKITAMNHTKHVDVRYKYVNEYVKYGIVKIVFV